MVLVRLFINIFMDCEFNLFKVKNLDYCIIYYEIFM